ncbi:hypothetical protein, partial [Bacillus mobilis]|uniref:hypothetical protein n=1 Tax=Bacillus mobilis TaxID=2026190 RepID=UPI0036432509
FKAAEKIHGTYGPGGANDVYVKSAATNIAKTSKTLKPKPVPTTPALPVRVGQTCSAVLAPDGLHVASVQWISTPIPGATLSAGEPTIPATLTWSATSVGVANYSVKVVFNDGTSKGFTGSNMALSGGS